MEMSWLNSSIFVKKLTRNGSHATVLKPTHGGGVDAVPVKPGDLLLSVIEFFGILIPGAVLVLLLWFELQLIVDLSPDDLLKVNGITVRLEGIGGWVVGFLASYILGHFLLSAGDVLPLDKGRMRIYVPMNKTTKKRYKEVCKHVRDPDRMPNGMREPETRRDFAFFTFNFIRTKNLDAIADIEKNAADYKLFRGLALVFLLNILFLISLAFFPARSAQIPWWTFVGVSLAGCVFSAIRFWQALNWTYRLGFEFYLILHDCGFPPSPRNGAQPSSEDSRGRETQREERSAVSS